MKSSRGFTVIELLVVVVVLAASSIIFFVQKNNIEVAARDETRKTSINAMYYGLEEVYYKAHNNSYPRTINSTVLPSIDPELFKDTNGVKIGESSSEYRYEPLDCNGDDCKSYTLRTTLENEADYIKKSRNN